MKKDKDEVLREYKESYTDKESFKKYRPMTLEGCVVRISDVIAYIGRDIEDAIVLGDMKRSLVPDEIVEVLGDTNKDIVNSIILDIIENSIDKDYIMMSEDIYKALFDLKKFNYENIYSKSISDKELEYYRNGMNMIFNNYLKDLETENKDSLIFRMFLNNKSDNYINNNSNKRIVIDFIAGMTDDFFLNEVKKACKIS